MSIEPRPSLSPDEQFSQLMNLLADRPSLKEKMVPDFSIIHELAPELERKVLQIASRLYGKMNCHGTSLYLVGLTEKPMPVSPKELPNFLQSMKRNTELLPKSLVCYPLEGGTIAHSGILLISKEGKRFILHKGGYNEVIKIEPIGDAFANPENDLGLESYSLENK